MLDLRRGATGPYLTPFGARVVEFALWLAAFAAMAAAFLPFP